MATREEFFLEAQKLGITPEMAVDILRRNGIKGKFQESEFDKYAKMLHDYTKCLERLMKTVNKIESKYYYLDVCPVCGAPIERDSKRDGTLGEPYAWKCTSPEQGLGSHFFQFRLEKIRPWMQRNQGMSEPEMSSEMSQEQGYPSGDNPSQTFSEPSCE